MGSEWERKGTGRRASRQGLVDTDLDQEGQSPLSYHSTNLKNAQRG